MQHLVFGTSRRNRDGSATWPGALTEMSLEPGSLEKDLKRPLCCKLFLALCRFYASSRSFGAPEVLLAYSRGVTLLPFKRCSSGGSYNRTNNESNLGNRRFGTCC